MELDVSKFQLEGEWLKLNLDTKSKDKETFSCLVKPLSDRESMNISEIAGKDLKEFVEKIRTLVTDWKLKVNGKDLNYTEANAKKFLPFICKMILEGEEEKIEKLNIENEKKAKEKGIEFKRDFPKDVGTAILDFAQDFNNFIKN